MMKIAWIGTGVMGMPMANHLAKHGYDVSVYNRTYEKALSMEPFCKAYNQLEDCVKQADIIFSIVGYPKDVEETYQIVMHHAKKGAILVDMTTSSPSLAIKLYKEAKSKGLYMLDAPVTGGDLGAINATLSIMVGGDYEVYEKVLPLFKLMGKTITYMGNPGAGMHAKLANQTAIAGAIMGLAEALCYAKDKKLDLERMLGVINGGSASSWQSINNGPKMINQDYKPGFYVKHFLKDLKMVMEEKEHLKLSVLENVVKAYDLLSNLGFQDTGTQSIIEYTIKQLG
jgi:3-hydroxyisobutyrate dehydrogenase